MRYADKRINSLAELITTLNRRAGSGPLWFRGQSNCEWPLVPQLGRRAADTEAEIALIKRFKQNALPHIVTRPSDEWEWLILMQHYRLPTRLLDWSESPLAALFFAVDERVDEDAALWCLDPIELNERANLKYPHSLEIPAFGHDHQIDNYDPTRIASEHTSDLNPVAVLAARNSPRIAAQQGAFTISHRTFTPIEDVEKGKHVWRMIIRSVSKERIQKELEVIRFNRLTLFPELDVVAEEAQRYNRC